jgi:hypothetical protein
LNRFTEKHYRFGLLLNAGVISREQFERAVAPEPAEDPLSRAAA